MKKISFFIPTLLLFCSALLAQVGINTDNSQPNASAMLDIKSTDKGFLLPRLTQADILAISSPANGLQVFCTSDSKMYIYIATIGKWKEVAYGPGTLPQFLCGNPITISHLTSGGVAPVNKTVTYNTVNNIPGELIKCWITRNLGASQQATEVSDATEASAGWYWQFNRKQGYKHDGIARTPNTAWITSISENYDWTQSNDPCTLELFAGWRLATLTEWTNVDASGNWTNWVGPFGSALKLHAAGNLDNSDGSLASRGSTGYYWSNTQGNVTNSWLMVFNNSVSGVNNYNKALGFTVRCVRDY